VGTYTVTATSQADTSKSDAAIVTVTDAPVVTVSISPKTASLLPNGTQTFTATVTGTTNTAVTWSVPAGQGSITQAGAYTAPATAGTYTVTATSQADPSKFDTATVTVVAASIVFSDIPKALFVNDSATLRASVLGLADNSVAWPAVSHGTISSATGNSATYTAPTTVPTGDGSAAVTATSVLMPSISGQAWILIRSLDFTRFGNDNNSKANPQLLDLASAFGSTAKADLDKYDLNGDWKIDDEDLAMLFKAMGW
jgi:hypothetical protein